MLTPLLMASFESVLNYFLYRDDALKACRLRLAGRVLKISLQEFDTAVYLSFYEQCLAVKENWEDPVDCVLTTKLSVLAQLRDSQQLTGFIRQGELNIEGDLQVVVQFVALLELVEWDLGEFLAPYTGDLLAQEVSTRLQRALSTLLRGIERQCDTCGQAIIEEWRLAPGALEVAWFYDEVAALERQIALLEPRFTALEGYL